MIPNRTRVINTAGGKGPAEALVLGEMDTPIPGPGEILIRVAAAGVNRPDVLQRRGAYPPPPGAPATLGLEVAGEVAAIGEGAVRWRPGDRVTALLGGGGYAEYAVVDARHALPIPKGLSLTEAAALPETVFTVFSNVFEIGALKAGETLMVHGANSGIGLTAVALAKAAGARVIATGRGPAKLEPARALGADRLVDVTAADFAEAALADGGVDVILDMAGGDYVPKNLRALKPFGRLVFIASLAGAKAELDVGQVMVKRLTVTGSTLRPRSADEKARLAAAVEATVWPWIEAGLVRPHIEATFPLAEAAKAHAWMEGDHAGKAVLLP
jgi:putative PIG3 family NAD(P)H quinone oxidoreductase